MIIKRKPYLEIPYTKEAVNKYKNSGNLLKHARTGENIAGVMLISKDTEDLIGYCAWEGDYIVALEVVSGERGKGFGETLMKMAMDKGARKLSVAKSNLPAINLYKKMGFKMGKSLSPKQIEMEYDSKEKN